MAKQKEERSIPICPKCGAEMDERSDGVLDCSGCGCEVTGDVGKEGTAKGGSDRVQ